MGPDTPGNDFIMTPNGGVSLKLQGVAFSPHAGLLTITSWTGFTLSTQIRYGSVTHSKSLDDRLLIWNGFDLFCVEDNGEAYFVLQASEPIQNVYMVDDALLIICELSVTLVRRNEVMSRGVRDIVSGESLNGRILNLELMDGALVQINIGTRPLSLESTVKGQLLIDVTE